MSNSQPKSDFFEVGDKTSLICTDTNISEIVADTLRELEFKFHIAENSERAIECIRYTPYDIVFLQEDFGASSLKSNAVHHFLAIQPMAQRRTSMVVLVGSSFKTLDAMQAFAYSVQLVMNTGDMPNLAAVLKKAWVEFDGLYRVYKGAVTALEFSRSGKSR
jgi:hypothetical protein